MKNKIDLVNDAFSMLLRTGVTVKATNADIELALGRLEDVMSELESRNMATGYNFENPPQPDSPSGLEDYMNLAVSRLLAVNVWPDFSPEEVNPMLYMQATQSQSNLSARLAQQSMLKYAKRMPLGSGNQPYQQYQKFYGDYSADCGTGCSAVSAGPTPPPFDCDAVVVDNLKLLASESTADATGKAFFVNSFYAGWQSPSGGGWFVWSASESKANHNGVTTYAPEALVAWSGAQSDIATLLNWTGSGSGCWLRNDLQGFVTPEMAGALYSISVNDTLSAKSCHAVANALGVPVEYSGVVISIDANAEIQVKTSVAFNGVEINIIGGVSPSPSFSSFNTLFVISDDETPVMYVSGAVSAADLAKGSLTPTKGLFDGHGYAELECGFQVPNRAKTGTMNYIQSFKVHRNGVSSNPLSVDVSAYASNIDVRYRKTSDKRLVVSNISIKEGLWNNQIIFDVKRCNVEIGGITMTYSENGIFDNVCKLINIDMCSDVTINDYITTGRPVTGSVGSYCLDIEGGADIYINRMQAITGWGATGTNNINGIYYSNCTLNRVDAHSSGHNIFVDNCDLQSSCVAYGWGGGVISVNNSRGNNTIGMVQTRQDYGGTFFGDIVVSNCILNNKETATIYAVNLITNPIGASSAVSCPETILVSNIKRIGKASANNAELIPVAIKVRQAGDIVYAPTNVTSIGTYCHPNWRYGLVIDYLNMERSQSGFPLSITASEARATSPATASTGIRGLTAVSSPTNPVVLRINVSDIDNLNLSCLATNGPTVSISNCLINGTQFDTTAAIQPNVSIRDCKVSSTYTGKIGANRSGNSNYTIITDTTFFSSVLLDISGASALQGVLINNGTTAPTLPAGATTDTAFTGFRVAGHFQ